MDIPCSLRSQHNDAPSCQCISLCVSIISYTCNIRIRRVTAEYTAKGKTKATKLYTLVIWKGRGGGRGWGRQLERRGGTGGGGRRGEAGRQAGVEGRGAGRQQAGRRQTGKQDGRKVRRRPVR